MEIGDIVADASTYSITEPVRVVHPVPSRGVGRTFGATEGGTRYFRMRARDTTCPAGSQPAWVEWTVSGSPDLLATPTFLQHRSQEQSYPVVQTRPLTLTTYSYRLPFGKKLRKMRCPTTSGSKSADTLASWIYESPEPEMRSDRKFQIFQSVEGG